MNRQSGSAITNHPTKKNSRTDGFHGALILNIWRKSNANYSQTALRNAREPNLKVTLRDKFCFDIQVRKLSIVVYAYNHITLEVEIRGFQVQRQTE